MTLLDRLRSAADQSPDMDLLAFLGHRPGDPFRLTKDGLTIGGETVPIADARLALNGGSIPQPPARRIIIGDL